MKMRVNFNVKSASNKAGRKCLNTTICIDFLQRHASGVRRAGGGDAFVGELVRHTTLATYRPNAVTEVSDQQEAGSRSAERLRLRPTKRLYLVSNHYNDSKYVQTMYSYL